MGFLVKRILGVFVPLSALVLAACGSGGGDDMPVSEIGAQWAAANAASVESLVATSDLVVVGTVSEQVEQKEVVIGSGLGDGARTLPAMVFRVMVSRAVFGVAQDDVLVTQVGGIVENDAGEKRRVILDQDETLEVGAEYMFFLVERSDGTYSSPPFGRFHVEDGMLAAIGGWSSTAGTAALDGAAAAAAAEEVASAAQ